MKRFLLLLLMSSVMLCAKAGWSDVTTFYIPNHDFSSGTASDWQLSYSRAWAVRANCMEFWNNSFFNVYRILPNLPKGYYRLSVQGYHRLGGLEAAWRRFCNSVPPYKWSRPRQLTMRLCSTMLPMMVSWSM